MLAINVYRPDQKLTSNQQASVVQFLFEHLDQYGDAAKDINKAVDYSMGLHDSPGGFVIEGKEDDDIVGAVVVNKTGMSGYIPENILVYIAVHDRMRGQGLGKKLMQKAIAESEGSVALHVEPDNPAKFLYEKLGFENKYLEMRLKK